jgi:hypothetical protein
MQKKDEYAIKKASDLKPRNIFNPHMSVKAILGWVNFNLLRIAKLVDESFIHGKNTEELSNDIQKRIKLANFEEVTFLMWDGSNFDSH